MATRPRSLRIRAYQVGFGDCFLLTFRYSRSKRNVLIDFGSTGRPKRSKPLDEIALQIAEECDWKLHGLVATHRHKDHISGFATRKNGDGPGDIIARCKPEVVIQPWTEDPRAARDAIRPTGLYGRRGRRFVSSLDSMQDVAGAIARLSSTLPNLSKGLRRRLEFIGGNNIANRSAVENLIKLGDRADARFVYYGRSSGLKLPGVRTRVLGPPTLKQTDTIRRQRSRDEDEFWHLRALGLDASAANLAKKSPRVLFPRAEQYRHTPVWARWIENRLQEMNGDSLMQIVRTLDHQLNNTSVILLFTVGDSSVLFPGDAQIENWSHALSKPHIQELLKGVNVYKVGHHGSLNATPRSLWNLFEHRKGKVSERMHSVVSTMGGKHGSRRADTEVPRETLVEALKEETHYLTTQAIRSTKNNFRDIEIDFRTGEIEQIVHRG
ncbi:MAG: hypothetical protein AAF581_07735 [Planctomycetota bacterium]